MNENILEHSTKQSIVSIISLWYITIFCCKCNERVQLIAVSYEFYFLVPSKPAVIQNARNFFKAACCMWYSCLLPQLSHLSH